MQTSILLATLGPARPSLPCTPTLLAHYSGAVLFVISPLSILLWTFPSNFFPASLYNSVPELTWSPKSSAASLEISSLVLETRFILKSATCPPGCRSPYRGCLSSKCPEPASFISTLREDGPNLCLWTSCHSVSGPTLLFSPAILLPFPSLKNFSQGFSSTPHSLLNLGGFTSKWMTV